MRQFLATASLILFCSCQLNCALAQQPVVKLYGQNNFCISGEFLETIFANSKSVFAYSQRGEMIAFDLKTGRPTKLAPVNVAEGSFISDSAVSPNGKIFAVSHSRVIELYETANPEKPYRKFDLPAVDKDQHYSTQTVKIDFSETGFEIYYFDKANDSLNSIEIPTSDSKVIRKGISADFADQLIVAKNGDILLLDSGVIQRFSPEGELTRTHKIPDHKIEQIVLSQDSIYVACSKENKPPTRPRSYPSKLIAGGFLEQADYTVCKLEADKPWKTQRWECDGRTVAIVNGRPVFRRGTRIVEGLGSGQIKSLASCSERINEYIASTDGKYFLSQISGGLRCWDTKSWNSDSYAEQPARRDSSFAVNNDGELIVLTDSSVFKSNEDGTLIKARTLSPTLTPYTSYKSLSADGSTLGFINKNNRAFRLDLFPTDPESKQPERLNIPNNARPTKVTVSADGKSVAVRFNPRIILGDPDASKKASKEAFKKGFLEGLTGQINRMPQLDESVAIFDAATNKPKAVDKIGNDAMFVGSHSPYVSARNSAIFWAAEMHVGDWGLVSENPRARSTFKGEIAGFCAFNEFGDTAYRQTNQSDPDGISARVFWLGSTKKFPRELVEEKEAGNQVYFASLPDDRKHVYLGLSEGFKSTIVKRTLQDKEAIWKIELPSRIERMRLSPNNKFLGVKLSDSRYAVISNIED